MKFKTHLLFFILMLFQIQICTRGDKCVTLEKFRLKFRVQLGGFDLAEFFTERNFLGKGSNSITYRVDWWVVRNGKKVNIEAAARITDIGNLSDQTIDEEFAFSRSIFKKVGNCVPEPYACIIDTAYASLIPDRNDATSTAKGHKKATSLRVIIMENGLGDLSTSFGENPRVNMILQNGVPTILNVFRQISFCMGRFQANRICHSDIKNDNYVVRIDNLALENHKFKIKTENAYRIMIIDYSDAKDFGLEVQSGTLKYADKAVIDARKMKKVVEKWDRPDIASAQRDIYAMGMSFLYILCSEQDRKEIARWFSHLRQIANNKVHESLPQLLSNQPIMNVCHTDPTEHYCFRELMENMLAVDRSHRTLSANDIYERLEVLMKISQRTAAANGSSNLIVGRTSEKLPATGSSGFLNIII